MKISKILLTLCFAELLGYLTNRPLGRNMIFVVTAGRPMSRMPSARPFTENQMPGRCPIKNLLSSAILPSQFICDQI